MQNIRLGIQRRLYCLFGIGYKRFGKKSCIYKPMLISGKKYISIGDHCNIYSGARIEAIDSWHGQIFSPSIEIGDNTTVENFLHMTCAGKIKIGHDCVISSRAYIANTSHDYSSIDLKVMDQSLIVKDIDIGNYCFIGMDVKIFPGVHIGDNVIIGANSIVMNDIPSYSVAVGIPAHVIKKYNFQTCNWERVKISKI